MFVMVNFHDLGDAIALVESFPCGSKTLFLGVFTQKSVVNYSLEIKNLDEIQCLGSFAYIKTEMLL